jgi:hypothetical protein
MLFILIAWLLVLLTFAIWLRALHSIAIYTNTPLELEDQTLQVKTVLSISQMLLAAAVACVALHFMLSPDVMPAQTSPLNASAMADALFFTS